MGESLMEETRGAMTLWKNEVCFSCSCGILVCANVFFFLVRRLRGSAC